MRPTRFGDVMAAISFLIWGLLPLYYQFIPNAAMDEMLAIRLIGSVPFGLLILVLVKGRLPDMNTIVADKRSMLYAFGASVMMCVSWSAFTWAITHERVIDASLGFFISPLTMVALGVLVLKERLSFGKKLGVAFASLGLIYQVVQYGEVPVIALIMALFFTFYGWLKKKVNYDWATCLFMEALLVAPFALVYIGFKTATGASVALGADTATFLLYVGSAPMTLLPLVFYSIAIRHTHMSNVGLMQYIEPSIQFLLAVWLFGEAFDDVKAVSFGLIWFGLLITIAEVTRQKVARSF
ncbi:EamA family transporter RarD [Vibrio sp. SCSIO 43136]|uniref:EamA family transporter RarD n=1 Tax=Vibrio sp. SCSIO 43136 TaxID=2819101 RepID=UPI0020761D2C|nr:EamA family transporter RarD [Vibrio sp. SCSIO 43136]USD66928.1 EamA family transporter RarD [Vibrio sp. SCSIO 43136]